MKVPLGDRMGIRGRLIILALGISLGSLIVLTLIQTRVTQNVLVEREARLLTSAAQLTANAIDDFIGKSLDNVRSDAQAAALARFLSLSPGARAATWPTPVTRTSAATNPPPAIFGPRCMTVCHTFRSSSRSCPIPSAWS